MGVLKTAKPLVRNQLLAAVNKLHGAGVWCTRDCRFCFKRAIADMSSPQFRSVSPARVSRYWKKVITTRISSNATESAEA